MPVITNAPTHTDIDEATKQKREIFSGLKLVIIVIAFLILIVLIEQFIISPFIVNGISMQPTFYTGDLVLVWKFPQTWARLTNSQYIPARSNLIVIQKTPLTDEQLIKRVIGLPGDTVVINNKLTVYNSSRPNGFDPDSAPYGKKLLPPSGTFYTQVGPGQVFVMGDNRNPGASIDSRSSIGNIPSRNIIGKVVIRLFPLNQITIF